MTKDKPQQSENFVLERPLTLERKKRRRAVRLEIEAPLTFAPINLDRPLSDLDENQVTGTILNISEGGLLLAGENSAIEGQYISMTFELRDYEMLTGIVGKVKRVDEDGEGGYLMGIEFCQERELIDVFGEANVGTHLNSFDERVKRVLLRHIFNQKVEQRMREQDMAE
jgi:c-di-GMP-binding flagellar brake protein YcgR